MKTYSLITTPPLIQAMQKALVQAGELPCVCLVLDLELHGAQGAAVIGGGTPFLPPVAQHLPLELIEARTFGSRVVYERYRRAR